MQVRLASDKSMVRHKNKDLMERRELKVVRS